MIQIVNISDARNNFAKLIQKIKETKKPVVIVQDSVPSAVIYPYEEALKNDEEKAQLFQLKFKQVFAEGEKAFKKYLNKQSFSANKQSFSTNKKTIKTPRTEQDAYSVIKNA